MQNFPLRPRLQGKQLESLMDAKELKTAFERAWWRIAHTFRGARSAPGRKATPYYIAGRNGLLSDLASYIRGTMSDFARDEIYNVEKLPEGYGAYFKGTPTQAVEYIVYQLILRELTRLRDSRRKEIWYMEGQGEWYISPVTMTEYDRFTKRVVPNPRGRKDFRPRTELTKVRRAGRNEVVREILTDARAL